MSNKSTSGTGEFKSSAFLDARVQERIDLGIDPMWQRYITDKCTEEIEGVAAAQQTIESYMQPGETTEEMKVRLLGVIGTPQDVILDLVGAQIQLDLFNEQGQPTLEELIMKHTNSGQEIRQKILEGGFFTSSEVLEMHGIDELELIRLINNAAFVVVEDHNELVFPAFQFSSPEAKTLVERIGADCLKYQTPDPTVFRIPETLRPYPSWTRTAWWFGDYGNRNIENLPVGERPIDLVLNGRIQELADRAEVSLE